MTFLLKCFEVLDVVSIAGFVFFSIKKSKGFKKLFMGLACAFLIFTVGISTSYQKSISFPATPSVKQRSVDPHTKLTLVFQEAITVNDRLRKVILSLSNGSVPAKALNQLDELNTSELNLYTDAMALNIPKHDQVDQVTLKNVISDLQNSIWDFQKYLNEHKVSEMVSAETNLIKVESGFKLLESKGY